MRENKAVRIDDFKRVKPGDRILVTSVVEEIDNYLPIGNFRCGTLFGKILEIKKHPLDLYDSILIEFDKDIKGHDGNQCLKKGKNGHCWWVNIDYLKKYAFFKLSPYSKRKHNFY